ncbi:4306_t:CDS:2, partial [Acaulospora colombiana]
AVYGCQVRPTYPDAPSSYPGSRAAELRSGVQDLTPAQARRTRNSTIFRPTNSEIDPTADPSPRRRRTFDTSAFAPGDLFTPDARRDLFAPVGRADSYNPLANPLPGITRRNAQPQPGNQSRPISIASTPRTPQRRPQSPGGGDDNQRPPTPPEDEEDLRLLRLVRALGTSLGDILGPALTRLIENQDHREPVNRTNESSTKIKDPTPFDGTNAAKIRIFVDECQVAFRARPRTYADDRAKINFALQYLSGAALALFSPYLKLQEAELPLALVNWDDFVQALKNNFGYANAELQAQSKLTSLKMEEKHKASRYIIDFTRLAEDTGWGGNPARIQGQDFQFERQLEQRQFQQLFFKQFRRKEEEERQQQQLEFKFHLEHVEFSQRRNSGGNSGKAKNKPDISKHLQENGKLKADERQRRIANNLCLFCGGKDHKRADCPVLKAKEAKARAAAVSASGSGTPTSSPEAKNYAVAGTQPSVPPAPTATPRTPPIAPSPDLRPTSSHPDQTSLRAAAARIDVRFIGGAAFSLVSRQSVFTSALHFRDSAALAEARLRAASTADDQEEYDHLRKVIPVGYHDFLDVFSKKKSDVLPEHTRFDHKIELEDGTTPPFGPIYSLSEVEQVALKELSWPQQNHQEGPIPSSSNTQSHRPPPDGPDVHENGSPRRLQSHPDRGRRGMEDRLPDSTAHPAHPEAHGPGKQLIVETDASDYAIAGIISIVTSDPGSPDHPDIHPIAFHSRTLSATERNYDTHDKELLAIFECFTIWRHYLEGAELPIDVVTDHNNLTYFSTTKMLTRRQARWSEYLCTFNLLIRFRPGRLGGKPDALTRRSDVYPKRGDSGYASVNPQNFRPIFGSEQLQASLRATALYPAALRAVTLMDFESLRSDIISGLKTDSFAQSILSQLPSNPHPKWSLSESGLLYHLGRVYVPDSGDLRLRVLSTYHDHPISGHYGQNKTYSLIKREYYWPELRTDTNSYIRSCVSCKRNKPQRHKPYGLLRPLPVLERPWHSISMDFIEELPASGEFNSILVVVDRLSKQSIFIPTTTRADSQELARLFVKHVFSKHGVPSH